MQLKIIQYQIQALPLEDDCPPPLAQFAPVIDCPTLIPRHLWTGYANQGYRPQDLRCQRSLCRLPPVYGRRLNKIKPSNSVLPMGMIFSFPWQPFILRHCTRLLLLPTEPYTPEWSNRITMPQIHSIETATMRSNIKWWELEYIKNKMVPTFTHLIYLICIATFSDKGGGLTGSCTGSRQGYVWYRRVTWL